MQNNTTTLTQTPSTNHPGKLDKKSEWRRFLLLGFVGLPIISLLLVCAYGFILWFGQMLFWGPPS